MKLYPAFYVLILLTVTIRIWHGGYDVMPELRAFLHDVFFVQSYFPGTYPHFWSLAVEEHFYILLPVMLYLMLRRSTVDEDDPFRFIPRLFVIVAAVEFAARVLTTFWVPFTPMTHLMATHLRLDSLLFGVLLSYWSIFHGERFWGFVAPRYPFILGVGVLLITPNLGVSLDSRWLFTYGFTLYYLGFGAIMVGLLALPLESLPRMAQVFFRVIAYIGGFSYSIYLWHIPWLFFLSKYIVLYVRYVGVFSYISGAIILGIAMSKLIEIPILRLRDRVFPAQGKAAPDVPKSECVPVG